MPITVWVILLLALGLAPILLIRFRKRWVAAFNLAVTNRITSRFAARLPGFGILTHVGRKSGRVYRTPVNVFRAPEGFIIALTYGRESEWVRNVVSAGSGQLETRGVQYRLATPTIVHDPTRRQFPVLVRIILRLIGADDFLRLSTSQQTALSRPYYLTKG
jgi:deazaflavin-dependent oxidoreductase (nitroreductase family)